MMGKYEVILLRAIVIMLVILFSGNEQGKGVNGAKNKLM